MSTNQRRIEVEEAEASFGLQGASGRIKNGHFPAWAFVVVASMLIGSGCFVVWAISR